jgi:hypothetical protein
VLRQALPTAVTTFRSDIFSSLTSGPLQHGAFTLFSLAIVVAAVLGLAKLAADAASFTVALTGLAVLAAVALGIEIRSGRRREASSLRIGE